MKSDLSSYHFPTLEKTVSFFPRRFFGFQELTAHYKSGGINFGRLIISLKIIQQLPDSPAVGMCFAALRANASDCVKYIYLSSVA